jgi:murein DD-endopeptidase MepM/ murein hydrolase activator NlpD
VQHTVKKGDTPASIAKLYKADVDEIVSYNAFTEGAKLVAGDVVIVPDGELTPPPTLRGPTSVPRGTGGPEYAGYYLRPSLGGRKTQGLHGYNGVDLATFYGAAVFASAKGQIIIARANGYNGGYGSYVVVSHPNGTQTLYAHLSTVIVSEGQEVLQGQVIGAIGSSGKSTGPHLHFEVRGAKNPF